MNERRTALESFWRFVTLIMIAIYLLSSSPVGLLVGWMLRDPARQLIFFSATGVIVTAVVIRFVVRTVNRHDDPRCVRLPDELP